MPQLTLRADSSTLPLALSGTTGQTTGYRVVLRSSTPAPTPDYVKDGEYRTPTVPRRLTRYKDCTYNQKMEEIMQGLWYEMATEDFLEKFIPGSNARPSQIRKIGDFRDLDVDFKNIEEQSLYPIVCRIFNAALGLTKAKATFRDVGNWRESDHLDMRPDLVLYPTNDSKACAAYKCDKKKSAVSRERKKYIARCAWAWMMVFGEVKCTEDTAPFFFSEHGGFLRNGPEAALSRAQICKYAAEIQSRQHRTHLFSFYLCGKFVRLLRWDRSGSIVSRPIDLLKDPAQMFNFIYRLANLGRDQLGYDLTAVLATTKDVKKLQQYKPDHPELIEHRNFVLNFQTEYPIHKVIIPAYVEDNPDEENKRGARTKEKSPATRATHLKEYLIGQHVVSSSKPTGRTTKAWVGFDLEDARLVFIKDQWRANASASHPEINTYERLKTHKVAYVATCLGGGDVVSPGQHDTQRTITHEYLSQDVENCERVHTRLVIKEIGRPLETYTQSGELLTATYHALLAHHQAWTKAKILHRDVSIGNIMIDVEATNQAKARGFLTDWDLCKYTEDYEDHVPVLPGRSGTWPFMSSLSQMYPRKPWELADDLEAFVYIPLFMALRFHHHRLTKVKTFPVGSTGEVIRALNATNKPLAGRVFGLFWEEYECEGGYVAGGDAKHDAIQLGTPPVKLSNSSSLLAKLLTKLYALLQEHYAAIDYADLERFKCQVKDSVNHELGQPSTEEDPTVRFSTTDLIKEDPDEDRILAEILGSEASPPPEPAGASSSTSHPSVPREADVEAHTVSVVRRCDRVLDNYKAITLAYHDVLHHNKAIIDFSNLKDKWFDQFDGLQTYVGASDRKSTSSKRKASSSSSAKYTEQMNKRVKGDWGWKTGHQLKTIPEEANEPQDDVRGEEDMQVGREEHEGPSESVHEREDVVDVQAQEEEVTLPTKQGEPAKRRSRRLANKKIR